LRLRRESFVNYLLLICGLPRYAGFGLLVFNGTEGSLHQTGRYLMKGGLATAGNIGTLNLKKITSAPSVSCGKLSGKSSDLLFLQNRAAFAPQENRPIWCLTQNQS